MAQIPHYFLQFNLLVQSRQVGFTITIAIIFTIAWVKYVYVKTVHPMIASSLSLGVVRHAWERTTHYSYNTASKNS